jgi:hypothetical protein
MTEQRIAARRSRSRLLWAMLAISAALNVAGSIVNPYLGGVFGVIVLGCALALVAWPRRGANAKT